MSLVPKGSGDKLVEKVGIITWKVKQLERKLKDPIFTPHKRTLIDPTL